MSVIRSVAFALLSVVLAGADAAAQSRQEGDFVLNDFTFHDGAKLPALTLHYTDRKSVV